VNADEIAERLFAAIESGDIEAVRGLYSPDVIIWHNTDGAEQTRDDNVRTLAWMAANLPGCRYTQVRRSLTVDGFVQQHVLVARNRAGEIVEVPACIVATVTDGVISRLDEYLDSAAITRMMAK
jgi:ketosteroid isomerase-like protein